MESQRKFTLCCKSESASIKILPSRVNFADMKSWLKGALAFYRGKVRGRPIPERFNSAEVDITFKGGRRIIDSIFRYVPPYFSGCDYIFAFHEPIIPGFRKSVEQGFEWILLKRRK